MLPQQASYARIAGYLSDYYSTDLYRSDSGMQHPLLFYRAEQTQIRQLDSVLGRFPQEHITQDQLSIYNYGYLHTLQNSKRHLYNGTTFIFKQLRKHPLRIEAHYGTYYDMLATCAALEQEILDATRSRLLRLPQRSQYHRNISPSQALTHGRGRSAAIGVAVLVVFNDAGTYKALLSRRTAHHATRPNAYHLLPAFIFQPMKQTAHPQEWSIRYHVYREFLEELFGMTENSSRSIYEHPALVDLQKMEDNESAGLYLTGIAMNLLTLRPEICITLVIQDPDWWKRIHRSGTELLLNTSAEAQEDLLLVAIMDPEQLRSALPASIESMMVPQAVVAFWEGLKIARQIINIS